jgi:HlyD family secretion protein
MTKNKLIVLSSIVIGGLFIFIGVKIHKKNSSDEKVFYITKKPIQKKIVQLVNSAGRLQARDEITVGSLVAGRVVKIHVDDNDTVKKGQLLVELDNGIGDSNVKKIRATLKEHVASLEYIKNVYERQRALYRENQISQETYEQKRKEFKQAKAKVEQTAADLESKKKEYENLFIKTPDDGIVISRKVDLGQMVTSQLQATELFKIAKDLAKMEARVDVDEADIGLIKEGQKAYFTVDAFPKEEFYAKVTQVRYKATIINNVVTYETILNIENPNLKLRPGMTCDVDIEVKNVKNAITVPNKSFRINDDTLKEAAKNLDYSIEKIKTKNDRIQKNYLWILENGKFKQIKVTTGAKEGSVIEIQEGINMNNDVVTDAFDPTKKNPFLEKMMQRNKKL